MTRQSSYAAKHDGRTIDRFGLIRGEIARARDSELLKAIRQQYGQDWDTLPSAWADVLDDDSAARMAVLIEGASLSEGAALIEYALLIALVILTILGVIIEVGIWVNGMWGNFPGVAP